MQESNFDSEDSTAGDELFYVQQGFSFDASSSSVTLVIMVGGYSGLLRCVLRYCRRDPANVAKLYTNVRAINQAITNNPELSNLQDY